MSSVSSAVWAYILAWTMTNSRDAGEDKLNGKPPEGSISTDFGVKGCLQRLRSVTSWGW